MSTANAKTNWGIESRATQEPTSQAPPNNLPLGYSQTKGRFLPKFPLLTR